jgi:hypothetical protein
MKITLDVAKLEQNGHITPEQRQWLESLAETHSNSVGNGVNILVGFGVIAVTAGTLAVLPSSGTAIIIGVLLWGAGYRIHRHARDWHILAEICVLIGAFLVAAGLLASLGFAREGFVLVSVLFIIAAAIIKSQLLAVLAAWAIFLSIGAMTGYFSGGYYLGVEAPTVTVLLFSALALGAFFFSKNLTAGYDRLALSFSRMSLVLVNFGFWVGSLWGDSTLGVQAFSITWALALVAVG